MIEDYLESLSDLNTLALDYIRALLEAVNNQSPSQFLEHICSCLARYHHALLNDVPNSAGVY